MRYIKFFIVSLSLLCSSYLAAATAADSPSTLLQQVSSKAIGELRVAKEKLPAGKKVPITVVHKIINQMLLPHVDLDSMSRAVLGRNAWSKATANQQDRFKAQFTDLVINTYASALTTFDKNRIKFYRIRGGYQGKSVVQVNSVVNAPGAPPLPVVYHMEKLKDGWHIFDLSVDGISLIESYKAQFSALLQQKGLDGLISTLASHNKGLMAQHKGKA